MGEQENFQKDPPKSEPNTSELSNEDDVEAGQEVAEVDDEEFDEDNINDEAFQNLDHQLDQLFVALDEIESKNDNLHAQLLQLLHSNREIRKELQDAQNINHDPIDKDNS